MTSTAPQRHTVFSGKYDKKRIRVERERRHRPGFNDSYVELYPTLGETYDAKVDEGDLLISVDAFNRGMNGRPRFDMSASTSDGHPFATSMLNGLQCEKAAYMRAGGSSEDERHRNAVLDSITFVGVALTSYVNDGTDAEQNKSLAILAGGMKDILANGPHDIYPLDDIAWDVPTATEKQYSDRQGQGFSASRKRLKVMPVHEMATMTAKTILDWFIATLPQAFYDATLTHDSLDNFFKPGNKESIAEACKALMDAPVDLCDEAALYQSVVKAAEQFSSILGDQLFDGMGVQPWALKMMRKASLLLTRKGVTHPEHSVALHAALDSVLAVYKSQWLKKSKRVFARSYGSATPGKMFPVNIR
jgi:hypothetical protein